MRPGIQGGRTAALCANSWPYARPQHAEQLRARHVPALLGMPISDAVHIPYRPRSPYYNGALHMRTGLLRSQGQISEHGRDACWAPARRPMHQYTKRSKHSLTEAGFLQRQLAQRPIKMPGSGLLTRHAQGEGIGGARRLSGGGFFLRLLLPFSLSALICLSAVASRSSGAQEQQDLDPPSYHAMGGSLKRSHRQAWRNCSAPMRTCTPLRCAGASSGRMSSLRIRHPRSCERAAVQSAGRSHASPKEEQNEAHNLDVGRPTHTLNTPRNLPQPPSLHAGPSPTWPSQTITFKGNHLACALSFFGLRYVVAAAVASTLPPTILPPDREKPAITNRLRADTGCLRRLTLVLAAHCRSVSARLLRRPISFCPASTP
ncbi:hypothetical protein TASIC1_0015016300 [Trichoderma asperellum]|uniref:Uncharacterized protein n=1 Tax=Trichoderma asperellum TaxID=101201 RepID=A0A6V8R4J8_TRIAP|nr:hypothetical protein TASIC1_0015016300 [Trichoderma asperellum]